MSPKSKILFEEEFICFLSKTYKGRFSGRPLAPKVVSDTLGRIRRIQYTLNIRVEHFTKDFESFESLSYIIKEKDKLLREFPTNNKYGYGRYIYAARLYYKFAVWKENKRIPTSNDRRIT